MPDGTEQLLGCQDGCLNRLSYIHCDPRTCPCGAYCSNRPFHLLKGPQLDVFLTQNRGHGVRVNAPMKAGQFVVEYAGEVRSLAHPDTKYRAWHSLALDAGPGPAWHRVQRRCQAWLALMAVHVVDHAWRKALCRP